MFNKYFVNDNISAITTARITAESNDRLGRKLEAISQAEIKSKDRVDISLDEYTRMQKRIETLEQKLHHQTKLIVQLGIPVEIIDAIKTDTVAVCHNDDIRDFSRHYMIKFDVDASPDLMKWRYEY